MLKKSLFLAFCLMLVVPAALADVYEKDKLIVLDKDKAGGGKGILYGKYAFTRDKAPKNHAVKEIGWLTVKPGDAIGYHEHISNEDVYIIVSGTGLFKDVDGKEMQVKAGDITICRKGQKHGITNNGDTDLVMISVIAEQ